MSVFCLVFSGVYAAAHDFKTEWVVVKGIKDFADETQSPVIWYMFLGQ